MRVPRSMAAPPLVAWAVAATLVVMAGQARGAPVALEIAPPPYPSAPAATAPPSEPAAAPPDTAPIAPAPPYPSPASAPTAAPPVVIPVPAPAYPPPPPRSRPSGWHPPAEGGLAVAQVGLGSLTMLLSVGVLGALGNETGSGGFAALALLASPTLVGLTVCSIGGRSQWYDGGCGPAVGGAYIGLLSAFPLAIAGCELTRDEGEAGCLGGAILGFAFGLLAGPPIGATIAWHISKEPRFDFDDGPRLPRTAMSGQAAPPRPAAAADADASMARRSNLAAGGARWLVPLLSMQF